MRNALVRERKLGFPHVKVPIKKILRSTFSWQQRYMVTRGDLPFVLNALKLTGKGAEIGVQDGSYSGFLLTHWEGQTLYSIDPWIEQPYYTSETPVRVPVPQAEQNLSYENARKAPGAFGDRSVILRMESLEAVKQFADGELDFVFIDALHEYDFVLRDPEAWYPKVGRGGIVSGHDYTNDQRGGVKYAVKQAVDDFCRDRGLKKRLTKEINDPSWFIFE